MKEVSNVVQEKQEHHHIHSHITVTDTNNTTPASSLNTLHCTCDTPHHSTNLVDLLSCLRTSNFISSSNTALYHQLLQYTKYIEKLQCEIQQLTPALVTYNTTGHAVAHVYLDICIHLLFPFLVCLFYICYDMNIATRSIMVIT